MTPEQEERIVCAFEAIAANLSSIARTMELSHQKQYPPKKEPVDATITHLKTEEEELRERLGETGEETTEDWLSLAEPGPRERAFLEAEAKRSRESPGSKK